MNYETTTRSASGIAADCLIIGIYERGKLGVAAQDIDDASGGWLAMQIRRGDVSSKLGKVSLLPAPEGIKAERLAVVGLGKFSEFSAARFRKALGGALDSVRERKIKSLAIGLTLEDIADASPYYTARHSSELVSAATYVFDEMKSKRESRPARLSKVTLLASTRKAANQAKLGALHGDAIGQGASLAKDLGNLPPNVCTPSHLARVARKQADKIRNLETQVLSEAQIRKLGMGSFLSVTGGTEEPAKLIVMHYRGATRQKPYVLVGKGITFDAGGISLKPPPAMDEMKFDMCGAAAVIGAITTVALLELPINVTVIVPTCENLPSGSATRPGDIVKSMSGQTIEILNTDAEGRLILCDALTYARRFKPEAIIDVATLTGACVIALGHHRTAVMSPSESLTDALLDAGIRAEDRAWPMPLADEYAEDLKSNFADFANVGSREGGAITAACFLQKFTDGLNWAHLDIAGTAWVGGAKKGATGRPVPMLSQYLLRQAGALPD
jgi:leucyl aminopeptidase